MKRRNKMSHISEVLADVLAGIENGMENGASRDVHGKLAPSDSRGGETAVRRESGREEVRPGRATTNGSGTEAVEIASQTPRPRHKSRATIAEDCSSYRLAGTIALELVAHSNGRGLTAAADGFPRPSSRPFLRVIGGLDHPAFRSITGTSIRDRNS